MKLHSTLLLLSLVAALSACGKSKEEEPEPKEEAAPAVAQAPAPAPAAPAAPERKEPTIEDIERWQRGMAAEKKAVQEAAAKVVAASDQGAKLEALSASLEMNTLDVGAAAAGVDRDAYRRIRSTFSDAVSTLSPLEMEMDVSKMPANMVEQMKQGREQSATQLAGRLSPELFAALKTRAAELRQQDKELVGERLKVANAAR